MESSPDASLSVQHVKYNVHCVVNPGGGGGGYSLCKAIRGCAALVGHFFEKNP